MKLLVTFSFGIFLVTCKAQNSALETKKILLESAKCDTIISFANKNDTFLIYREINIIENLNSDTLLLGYSIIPPNFIGKIRFIQDGLDASKLFI